MNGDVLDLRIKGYGEPIHISPFSDLHSESPYCDLALLKRTLNERRALKNSIFIGVGDFFNSILPGDLKRYKPSENHRCIAGRDDMVDEIVSSQQKLLGGYPWVLMAQGNHEHSTLKNQHTDLIHRLCEGMELPDWVTNKGGSNIPHGAYTGFLRLRIWDGEKKAVAPRCSIDIAYHHGAWGGQGKGVIGMARWAGSMTGARIFLVGHNHQTFVDPSVVTRLTSAGVLEEQSRHTVLCGSYLRGGIPGVTSYSEIKGLVPSYRGTPLITLKMVRAGSKSGASHLDVKVTV